MKGMSANSGEFGVDESCFGARKVRGRRAGERRKTSVFGLPKRGGKVSIKAAEDCFKEELMSVIQGKALEGSVVHTDGCKAYIGLL